MIFKYFEMQYISLGTTVCDFSCFLGTQMRYLLQQPKNAAIENLSCSAAIRFKSISSRPVEGPRGPETGLSVNTSPGGSPLDDRLCVGKTNTFMPGTAQFTTLAKVILSMTMQHTKSKRRN